MRFGLGLGSGLGLGLGEGEAATRPAAHATKGRCSPSDCAITPPSAGPMAKPMSALCSSGAVVCARLRGVAMSDR